MKTQKPSFVLNEVSKWQICLWTEFARGMDLGEKRLSRENIDFWRKTPRAQYDVTRLRRGSKAREQERRRNVAGNAHRRRGG